MEQRVVQPVDYMKLLYDSPDVSIYELDAIHLDVNSNQMSIDEDCVNASLASFADKPLYCVIDNTFNPLDGKHNDFMEHFREKYPWRITRDRILPFGCVPESALKDARLVERDGRTYLRINVVVWKSLLPHVSEILQRRDGDVKVSVEFVIEDAEQCPETGILYIHKFHITAITALGEKFKEVMDGSRLKTVRFSYDEYAKNSNPRYFAYSKYNSVEIPQTVLNAMKDGIALREKCGRGGTKSLYESVKRIANVGIAYDDDIVTLNSAFSAIGKVPEKTNPITSKYIQYSMLGGSSGKEWITNVCNGSAVAINKFSKGGSSEVNIQIDNKKESAINGQSWENPGKALYEPIMEASNEESLVKEAYLVVEDGWKDAPSEHLKYPHHEVKDGKLVLNVAGVKAAFARASQQGIVDGDVKKHLERHYRELGLSMENFEAKCAELQKTIDKLNADLESKCSEFNQKCADLEASNTACQAAEQKCADLQAELDAKCAEYEDKCAKLAEYEKKEVCAQNMAMIDEYCNCFDPETLNALKEKASAMSCDEMKAAVSEAVMSYAKKVMTQDGVGEAHKFSYGFPPMNQYFDASHQPKDKLSSIRSKYKTNVM